MRFYPGLCLAMAILPACGTQQGRNEDKSKNRPAGLRDTCTADAAMALAPSMTLTSPVVDSDSLALTQRLGRGLPEGLSTKLVATDASVGARHYDFRYEAAGGLPLCDHLIRAHVVGDRTLVDGELALSSLPDRVDLSDLVWLDAEASAKAAARSLGLASLPLELRSSSRCFQLRTDGPAAAWELRFHLGGKPYAAIANGNRVTSVEAKSFDVSGSAKVFDSGPTGGSLITVELPGLLPGDGLSSALFQSAVESGPLALEPTRVYDYEPSDPRFAEVSAFAHVEQMAEWLMLPSHHYHIDCVPITVKTHVVFTDPYSGETSVNNAEYHGADETPNGFPAIYVGDGDGEQLANIAVDFDTVAHELGHHVIYRKLTSKRGTSAVLHEGLADYLVFAKTGDNCIGESICPAGSLACEVVGHCLRSGENHLSFLDEDLPVEAHRRSQLVSGMLWDLGKVEGIGQATVASLVIKGIDYLLPASDYGDLFKALMAADLELFDGVHACTVREQAIRRGFADVVQEMDCATDVR